MAPRPKGRCVPVVWPSSIRRSRSRRTWRRASTSSSVNWRRAPRQTTAWIGCGRNSAGYEMIETLYKDKFVKLSKSGTWEYAERVNSTGAGFILAVTPEQELVLVEQYRVPMQARTIELPAGIIGDEGNLGEAVEASALRELEEETGYRGARAEILLSGPVAPGLASEMLHQVRVHDLQSVSARG